MTSGLLLFIVGLIYRFNKQGHVHPYALISLASFATAGETLHFFMLNFIWSIDPDDWTTIYIYYPIFLEMFSKNDGPSEFKKIFKYLDNFEKCYYILSNLFYNTELITNCILFIDIYLILRNPFYP